MGHAVAVEQYQGSVFSFEFPFCFPFLGIIPYLAHEMVR
jgi:hypothetical protein